MFVKICLQVNMCMCKGGERAETRDDPGVRNRFRRVESGGREGSAPAQSIGPNGY